MRPIMPEAAGKSGQTGNQRRGQLVKFRAGMHKLTGGISAIRGPGGVSGRRTRVPEAASGGGAADGAGTPPL